MSFENPNEKTIVRILKEAKRIAIIGLSNNPERSSYEVAEFMQKRGYKIIPINPQLQGQEILQERVYGNIEDVPGHIDIIDVFRRSEFLPEIAESVKNLDFDIFWAQLDLFHEDVPAILGSKYEGKIVMNRCLKMDYESLIENN